MGLDSNEVWIVERGDNGSSSIFSIHRDGGTAQKRVLELLKGFPSYIYDKNAMDNRYGMVWNDGNGSFISYRRHSLED